MNLKTWVREEVANRESNPWPWFAHVSRLLIRRAGGEDVEGLENLDLSWLDHLVAENKKAESENRAASPHDVPALQVVCDVYRLTTAFAEHGAALTLPVGVKTARQVIDPIIRHHTEHKCRFSEVCVCDPLCGFGSLLAVSTMCGLMSMGFESHPNLVEVGRALMPEAHLHEAKFGNVVFKQKEAEGLHYIVTRLPAMARPAIDLLGWVARTCAGMLRGDDRLVAGAAPWQVVILTPKNWEKAGEHCTAALAPFKIHQRVGIAGSEIPDSECLLLSLK